MDAPSFRLKRRALRSEMIWNCISTYRTSSLHIWNYTISADWYVQVLEEHVLPFRLVFSGKALQISAAAFPYQIRMGQHSSPRGPAAALLRQSWLVQIKIRLDPAQWVNRPCPNVFETCCCYQIGKELISFLKWYWISLQMFDMVSMIYCDENRLAKIAFAFYTASQLSWNWDCILK